jgi:hypothetical protein
MMMDRLSPPSSAASSLVLLALLAVASPVGSQTHDDAPSAVAARLTSPVTLDGRLDEEAWAAATPITAFTQLDPAEGEPVTERTEIRFLYDDHALYIGARLYDRGPVTTRLGRRDMSMERSDWLTVILDSYHDHRTAYGFEVNPSGVRRDQTRSTTREDDSWDPVWEARTTIDADGWTAEIRIPFSQLRFNPADRQTWGLQVERQISRTGEFAVFSFTPRSEPGGIARFGHLRGLAGLHTGKRLEVLPYSLARTERVDASGNPFRSDHSYGISAGVDLKYRVTSDLTLDATVNPDFGQVELDPAEVNLSAVETRFQERRPFFVEGSEIFNFGSGGGNSVFYSRRIGRTPQLGVPSSEADVPEAARILSAAKLSGRTAGGWSVGVLNAVTGRTEARYHDPDGREATALVEPLSNYFVGRLRRDLRGGQTVVGGMVTGVHRDLADARAEAALRSGAYVGGLDFRTEWANRTMVLTGFASGSHIRGSEAVMQSAQHAPWRYAQRPDADHLALDSTATSMSGLATEFTLTRRAGRNWRSSLTAGTITPAYEINDLGFQLRADRRDLQGVLIYQEQRPGRTLRSWNLQGVARSEWNTGGDNIMRLVQLSGWAQHLNYWNGNVAVSTSAPVWDDRLTRGGPLARRPGNVGASARIASDWRQKVVGATGWAGSVNDAGGWSVTGWGDLSLKPSERVNLGLFPSLTRAHSRAQYLGVVSDSAATATFGRRYLFAELDQSTLALEARLNLTLNPDLSLQIYAQPFLTALDFGEPAEFARPRDYEFLVYGRDVGEVDRTDSGYRIRPRGAGEGLPEFALGDPTRNIRSLRGNAVLRYEWRPGSTLFVAWQQTRDDLARYVGDLDFGRDRSALFRAAPENVLVIKMNYWLNP